MKVFIVYLVAPNEKPAGSFAVEATWVFEAQNAKEAIEKAKAFEQRPAPFQYLAVPVHEQLQAA